MKHARTKHTIGAAALLITLTSCSDDVDGGLSTSAEMTTSSATTPTAEVTTSTEVASNWLPLETDDTDADGTDELEPGEYGMTANGLPDMPWAVVTVRGGFANLGGWLLKDPDDGPVRGVGYWTVSAVDRDPCGVPMDFIDVGSSVEDLVAAFAAQKLTRTTEPVPITLDGYSGLLVELHVPSDIDFSDCGEGLYQVWVSDPRGGRSMQEPGQVDRLWILDVDGNTVVLHATAVPAVTREWRQRQTTMVESVRFVVRD